MAMFGACLGLLGAVMIFLGALSMYRIRSSRQWGWEQRGLTLIMLLANTWLVYKHWSTGSNLLGIDLSTTLFLAAALVLQYAHNRRVPHIEA